MDIQLANVLSDVSGVTGQAIIKAILAGERDPHELAAFRDCRVKARRDEIAPSLEGNWQEDLLFVLQQEQEGHEFCQRQMAECDRQLQRYLQEQEDRSHGADLPEERTKGRRQTKKGNAPQFNLREEFFSHDRYGPDGDRRRRGDDGDHDPSRSRMGYEPMERREPFRFLAAAVPRQSDRRQQGHWVRLPADEQTS